MSWANRADMPTQIKICGLKDEAGVDAAARAGATHIGLNLYEKSPRYVPLEQAAALRMRTPEQVKVVLLLVNAEPGYTAKALEIAKPDVVQFHGTETPEWLRVLKGVTSVEIWKALGVKDAETLKNSARFVGAADLLLFDAPAQALPGGTGMRFDWSLLAEHRHELPWGLAGGFDSGKCCRSAAPDTGADGGYIVRRGICARHQGYGQDCPVLQSGARP